MVRPNSSSFHRTVRFNGLLREGGSASDTDSTDESSNGQEGEPTQDTNRSSQSKKVSQALADDNKYVEFRRILKRSPSSRKVNGNRSITSSTSRSIGGSTSFTETRKSSSFSTIDNLKVITNPATNTSTDNFAPSPPPSPQGAGTIATAATAETVNERDDAPSLRNDDDNSVDARSNGTLTSVALSTHAPFSIPEGDSQNMKVVCQHQALLEVQTTSDVPMPVHKTDVVVAVEASSVSP